MFGNANKVILNTKINSKTPSNESTLLCPSDAIQQFLCESIEFQ